MTYERQLLTFEATTYGSLVSRVTVPTAGFRWASRDELRPVESDPHPGVKDQGPWLVENDPACTGPRGVRVTPLRKGKRVVRDALAVPVAFSKLAHPDQIREFADNYGFLGRTTTLVPPGDGMWVKGEPLAIWLEHVHRVRVLLQLMEWIKRRDEDKLQWVFRWVATTDNLPEIIVRPGAVLDWLEAKERGERYCPIPANATLQLNAIRQSGSSLDALVIAATCGGESTPGPDHLQDEWTLGNVRLPEGTPWFWRLGRSRITDAVILREADGRPRWRDGEVVGPALYYVCEEINAQLRGRISPCLMPFALDKELGIYFVPDCMLSNIYLGLQLIATRGKAEPNAKLCERPDCANDFQPSGNRRYCSEACSRWGRQQQNLRQRKKSKCRLPD